MNNITTQVADQEMTFSVEVHEDHENEAPWENEDGHGPVTGWVKRDKRPGELLLNSDRDSSRYYDFKEACKLALRDRWGCKDLDGTETKRQKAAKSAMADFYHLKAWCDNDWAYVGVEVTLLDSDGNKTEVSESVWGVESIYAQEKAKSLADDLASGLGTIFEAVKTEVASFKRI